jgi:hypothetical protein
MWYKLNFNSIYTQKKSTAFSASFFTEAKNAKQKCV